MKHAFQEMSIDPFVRIALVQREQGGLSNPHVDACEPGIETAREELSILTGLPNKIARTLDFPRRLPLSTGRLYAASDETCPYRKSHPDPIHPDSEGCDMIWIDDRYPESAVVDLWIAVQVA